MIRRAGYKRLSAASGFMENHPWVRVMTLALLVHNEPTIGTVIAADHLLASLKAKEVAINVRLNCVRAKYAARDFYRCSSGVLANEVKGLIETSAALLRNVVLQPGRRGLAEPL